MIRSLCDGESLAKTVVVSAASPNWASDIALDLWPEQNVINRQPNLPANGLCDNIVIACQDLDGYTMLVELIYRLRCRFLWRVQKGQVAQECQVRFILDRIMRSVIRAGEHPVGHGNDAKTFRVQVP